MMDTTTISSVFFETLVFCVEKCNIMWYDKVEVKGGF